MSENSHLCEEDWSLIGVEGVSRRPGPWGTYQHHVRSLSSSGRRQRKVESEADSAMSVKPAWNKLTRLLRGRRPSPKTSLQLAPPQNVTSSVCECSMAAYYSGALHLAGSSILAVCGGDDFEAEASRHICTLATRTTDANPATAGCRVMVTAHWDK